MLQGIILKGTKFQLPTPKRFITVVKNIPPPPPFMSNRVKTYNSPKMYGYKCFVPQNSLEILEKFWLPFQRFLNIKKEIMIDCLNMTQKMNGWITRGIELLSQDTDRIALIFCHNPVR